MVPLLAQEYDLKVIKNWVKNSNTSRIYGFILYTDKNPHIKKVLRDDDYWKAFDEISGANWPIFTARPLNQGSYEFPKGQNFGMSMMVSVWEEPENNIPILKDFGFKDSQELPCFVAFIWDDDDNLQKIEVSIEDDNIDTTYKSIKKIVEVISNAESHVLPEYKNNIELFNIVSKQLETLKFQYNMKKMGRITKKFLELFSLFK